MVVPRILKFLGIHDQPSIAPRLIRILNFKALIQDVKAPEISRCFFPQTHDLLCGEIPLVGHAG